MTNRVSAVLDSSAVLALMHEEPGAERVIQVIADSAISAVNLAEVLQRAVKVGQDADVIRVLLEGLGLTTIAFTDDAATTAAKLWHVASKAGLSLADRACLALASELDVPALTADKAWSDVDIDVQVKQIR